MRAPIFLLLVASFFCGTTLWGQYPTEEKIQPYSAPVKERTLRQRFLCNDEEAARWRALSHATLTTTGESFRIESSDHDPYVFLPPLEQPRGGAFEFRIRMKNNMRPGAEIFWQTTTQTESHADNAVRFGFVPDGEWHTYTVEFTTTDPLTGLRFDPGNSAGVAEIAWIELYDVVYGEVPENPTPWVDPKWERKIKLGETISSGHIKIRFDSKGTGAIVLLDDKVVGEIYPLTYHNPLLPLGGNKHIPFYQESSNASLDSEPIEWGKGNKTSDSSIEFSHNFVYAAVHWNSETGTNFSHKSFQGKLRFDLKGDELRFELKAKSPVFGPAFRPHGEMQQALLSGVEYLEKGEHSSSTADIETKEHLRFAPNPMDVTWPFMSIVTDKAGFGLLWNDPHTQAVFATPDFIFGDATKHHMGLYGKEFSGTLKIVPSEPRPEGCEISPQSSDCGSDLILWAFQKRGGAPDLPKRFRTDEEQRLLNLAAFEKSCIVDPGGNGWRFGAIPHVAWDHFPLMHGSDYVTAVWQLSGKLPDIPSLALGGGHLPNPASFFLLGDAENFRIWKRNESAKIRREQRPDGSWEYKGKYLRGHWEDTTSGHCGNELYRLLYTYQILGEPEALAAAIKGLEFANKYSIPRGAQVWELSLHTPDIVGSSRMCMANVWAFEATGDQQYLDHARRWAITGLPFVYFWERKPLAGKDDPIMLYATTPVFGATDWVSPNWIGWPVQWCGLDYGEACFMLAKHDSTLDWNKIAEGILITAERMQYTEGPSIGLLPDSYSLPMQIPYTFDMNPSVLVQQRRRLQGKIDSLAIVLSADKKYRVVSPYKTTIEGTTAVIEGVAGTTYQIIVNGKDVRTIESKGVDHAALAE